MSFPAFDILFPHKSWLVTKLESNKIHGAIEFFWQKFCPAKNFLSKLKEVLSASFLMACIRAINIPNDIYSNLTLMDKFFRNSIFIFYIYCKKTLKKLPIKQLLSNFKSIQVFLKQFLEMQITSSLYTKICLSRKRKSIFEAEIKKKCVKTEKTGNNESTLVI